jgi:hypothetical protein
MVEVERIGSKRFSSPTFQAGRAGINPVLPRGGLVGRPALVWRRRPGLYRAPLHQTQHPAPPPRTRVGVAAPAGGRRRASHWLYSVRTPCGWLGQARGEFLAPDLPLGLPAVLPADMHHRHSNSNERIATRYENMDR